MYCDALAVIGDWGSRWAVVCSPWETVLPALPSGCVQHFLFDPPYSEHVHSKSRAGSRKSALRDGNGHLTRCAFSRETEFGFPPITLAEMESLSQHAERLATRWTGAFCDVESVGLWKQMFEGAGLSYRRSCAWIKEGCTPQFSGDRPGVGFECIVMAHKQGRSRWNGGGKQGVYSVPTCIERGGNRRDNDERMHPTQKPLDLMLRLIEDFTDPDDIVIDPTAGSCTTGVACLRLGRRFIGIERSFQWAAIGRERLQGEESQTTVRAMRAKQTTIFERCIT